MPLNIINCKPLLSIFWGIDGRIVAIQRVKAIWSLFSRMRYLDSLLQTP